MSEELPRVAGRTPVGLELEPGTYWWCKCGKSANQPFCDGSHKGSGIVPLKLEVEEKKKVWLCMCKQSMNAPLCDGSHKELPKDEEG